MFSVSLYDCTDLLINVMFNAYDFSHTILSYMRLWNLVYQIFIVCTLFLEMYVFRLAGKEKKRKKHTCQHVVTRSVNVMSY